MFSDPDLGKPGKNITSFINRQTHLSHRTREPTICIYMQKQRRISTKNNFAYEVGIYLTELISLFYLVANQLIFFLCVCGGGGGGGGGLEDVYGPGYFFHLRCRPVFLLFVYNTICAIEFTCPR